MRESHPTVGRPTELGEGELVVEVGLPHVTRVFHHQGAVAAHDRETLLKIPVHFSVLEGQIWFILVIAVSISLDAFAGFYSPEFPEV